MHSADFDISILLILTKQVIAIELHSYMSLAFTVISSHASMSASVSSFKSSLCDVFTTRQETCAISACI